MTNTSRSNAGAPIGAGIAIGAALGLIFGLMLSGETWLMVGGGVVAGLLIGAMVDLLRARSRRPI